MLFHLGPLGGLEPLPEIEHDAEPDASASATGKAFESLTGARSFDRIGPYRRTWQLPWKYLSIEEFDLLDAMRRGHLGGPLWVVDPSLPNLVNAQIASGGAERRSVRGWTTISGSRRWVRPANRQSDLRTVGAIEWTKQTAEDTLTTGREVSSYRCPLLGDAGPVTVAARIMRTDSPTPIAVRAGVDTWTAAGGLSTVLGAEQNVGGSWTELVFTLASPATDAASVAPAWRVAAGTSATFYVTGVRVGYGSSAPAPSRGGGAAVVVMRDLPQTYPSLDEFSFALTLDEA